MKRRTFFTTGAAGAVIAATSQRAQALEFYPMPSEQSIAILYGTWCGSTRDTAVWISEGMNGVADVFDIRENPNLRSYDHIVIGSAIRANAIRPELQEYIAAHKTWLQPKIKGLFAVCGNMGMPVTPELIAMHINDNLAQLTGASGVPGHVFNGRVTKGLMDAETLRMMTQAEDYDLLSRPECMDFGKEVLAGLM